MSFLPFRGQVGVHTVLGSVIGREVGVTFILNGLQSLSRYNVVFKYFC